MFYRMKLNTVAYCTGDQTRYILLTIGGNLLHTDNNIHF